MEKIGFGIVILVAGILLLGLNLGFIDNSVRHIIFAWPMILIALGFINLFNRKNSLPGFLLLGVGLFFMLPRFDFMPYHTVRALWPIALIFAGIYLILRRKKRTWHKHQTNTFTNASLEGDYLNESNVFGGSNKIIVGKFTGGRVENVFGGSKIDLKQAELVNDKTVLYTDCVFGGLSLYVPNNWIIDCQVDTVLGGFEDKRYGNLNIDANSKTLVIKGTAVFGGIEVKY